MEEFRLHRGFKITDPNPEPLKQILPFVVLRGWDVGLGGPGSRGGGGGGCMLASIHAL